MTQAEDDHDFWTMGRTMERIKILAADPTRTAEERLEMVLFSLGIPDSEGDSDEREGNRVGIKSTNTTYSEANSRRNSRLR
jgi:hypothetical protein